MTVGTLALLITDYDFVANGIYLLLDGEGLLDPMRVRVTTKPPLPPIKAWFPVPSSSDLTVADFKSHLCKTLPTLHACVASLLRLSIDEFELLDECEIGVVRDGDLVCVEQIEPSRHAPKADGKHRTLINTHGQAPHVPPGFGKPQTQARNRRRRIKRLHDREATAVAVAGPVSGANAVTYAPDNEIEVPAHSIGDHDSQQSQTPNDSGTPDPLLTLPSLSLRNKNKAKNFRLLLGKPLPAKIIFADDGSPQAGPSSDVLRPPPVDVKQETSISTRSTVEPRQAPRNLPPLVPPSERSSLPPNLFVTSVDVEAGLWRPKKKRKTRDAIEYGAGLPDHGHFVSTVADGDAEASIILDYGDSEDPVHAQQERPQCQGNTRFTDADINRLEQSANVSWTALPKITHDVTLEVGDVVAYKNQSGTLRNVLQHQSSGSTSTVPWAAGPGSSWGGAGTGAGPGGAKFNAGSKFYTGYTGAGRAVTQANASTGHDPARDDEKEEVSISLVAPRQPSSRPSRSLTRRHSLSFPPGRRDHERETGAGVLQTVQTHLRERHTFARAEQDQQDDCPSRSPSPQLSAGDAKSSLDTTVEEAFAAKDTSRIVQLITELTDRDHDVQKTLRSIEVLSTRRRLATQSSEEADASAIEEAESKRKEALLAEDNFRKAMSIFDVACVTSAPADSDSTPSRRRAAMVSRFPASVYHALLRSCAYHASVDAAIRVYSHLEARILSAPRPPSPDASSSRTPFYPTTSVFYYLLTTYVNANDLAGAKEVFAEFKSLCASGQVAHLEPSAQVRIWNKMMEAYFRAGQPAGALRLLETMMDAEGAKGSGQGENVIVPSPASSTFTTIITGFCNPAPHPVSNGTAPQPDIATALSWFNRLLLQPTAAPNPYEPSSEPTRPDQRAWTVMLEVLSQASATDKSRTQDLNRLFDAFVECAPKDNLDVKPTIRSMVLDVNMRLLEEATDSELASASLSFIARHITAPHKEMLPYTLQINDSARSLVRAYPQFVRFGMAEQAWELARNLVAAETSVIEKTLTEGDRPVLRMSRELLSKVTPLALEAVVSSSTEASALSRTVEMMRFVATAGLQPTPGMSSHHLHAFMVAPVEAQRTLNQSDYETLLLCALALPAKPSPSDLPQGCAYTSLTGLLQVMNNIGLGSQVARLSNKVVVSVTEALYESCDAAELSEFLAGLDSPFHCFKRRSLSPSGPPPPPSAESPPPQVHVIIDSELSRYVDEWCSAHSSLTAHDGYARLQKAMSAPAPRYPHPAVLGRLINGLGRAHDVSALRSVYAIAQQVLFSPFLTANPSWQSQAWFQIEDQMIIAYAHAGDMDSAFMHRERITAAGGVPSPDAYGSLIECVRDTTDDTSNAMNLFLECQMLGTKPNVYLYNTIISKLAKARKADFALDLFQQMKGNTSLRPSSITYGAVIAACARVGDAQAAEMLFEEMASQPNFRPRIPPYNTMMQMYTHTKPDRERVLHYFNLMLAAGINPSAHTYKLLIDAYGTIEPIDVEAMEKTFETVESSHGVSLQGSHWAALINAHGCVCKDLDKAISIFDSIASHPASKRSSTSPLPDAVTYEALINVLVTHKRMDLVPVYLSQLQASGVHMTAYIANLMIKGYAATGDIEEARRIFESLEDPPSGVAAPNNHVPHDSSSTSLPVSSSGPSYREPSTWEAMFRAELGNGHRDRAVALLDRLQERQFPPAVYNRIRGIMLDDDSVSPWAQSPPSQSP
ncbi:hypothetical protein ID866_4817 [Astraeus odoratus]|nr:hypothetical protein ID866_4817 [Astraeus odoratus]